MKMTKTKTVRCLVETDPNTGCLVGSVPNMAGANTQGQTLEELKANMHEVLCCATVATACQAWSRPYTAQATP